jgi:hypothetical protein
VSKLVKEETSTMMTRRQALMRTLFGVGAVGLRSLATGIPAAFLLNPKRALANGACANPAKAQYFILSTSGNGDPINAGAPGTYGDPKIVHSPDPNMAGTGFTLAGKSVMGAKVWSTLPQNVLDRTTFWHLMTNTPIHPKEPEVLKLNGATPYHEMFPSLIAKVTAPCLGTIQQQPFSVGGSGPSEALAYNGSVMPIIPPVALKDTLTSAAGPLANLQALRDSTMTSIYNLYKTSATPAEKAFIDATANTQDQVRHLNQALLTNLTNIKDNSVASQITAAVTLIQMNVAPVISIHIPFGGDNHSDANLATEANDHINGVASIASLMAQLTTAGLQDKVSFMTLNVFGRTLATNGGGTAANGRAHNPNHQVSVTIGAPFKGGVIGGVAPVANDYGATGINSTTGAAMTSGGDISAVDSLGAYAQTVLSAVGGDTSVISTGKVIGAALV